MMNREEEPRSRFPNGESRPEYVLLRFLCRKTSFWTGLPYLRRSSRQCHGFCCAPALAVGLSRLVSRKSVVYCACTGKPSTQVVMAARAHFSSTVVFIMVVVWLLFYEWEFSGLCPQLQVTSYKLQVAAH